MPDQTDSISDELKDAIEEKWGSVDEMIDEVSFRALPSSKMLHDAHCAGLLWCVRALD